MSCNYGKSSPNTPQGHIECESGCTLKRTPVSFQESYSGTLVLDFYTGETLGLKGSRVGEGLEFTLEK